ncbi:MAG: hypothetical protein Q8R00_00065 [Candidatus Nanoarchaeia archaeon]|nr:hypothetical protein [Candidatus Nanoarchaeia archaeon]
MTYKIDGIDYTEQDYKSDLKLVKTPRILNEARSRGLVSGNISDRIEDKREFLATVLGRPVLNGNGGEKIDTYQADPRRIMAVFTKEIREYLALESKATSTGVGMAEYRIKRYEPVRRKVTLEEKLKKLGQDHISRMHMDAIGLIPTEEEIRANPTGENKKHS